MYVVFIYAKSYHYLNNTLFTITLLQKEYPVNFMNPSIYFMVYLFLFLFINNLICLFIFDNKLIFFSMQNIAVK